MLNKILKKPNDIYVSIGEEGIAVVYFIGKHAAKKLFIRSINDEDTLELKRILLNDGDAVLHLYIDVLDQTYIQRTLPAISAFNIDKLAQQRLEKETIKTHLKSCLQIGRTEVGRNDWVYIFISTAFEPPISIWIKFFEEYQNIIQGIHFLPVELATVVKSLNNKRAKSISDTNKTSPLTKLISMYRGNAKSKASVWEVLLTLNKSGGFRQAVFQDGKIIFTRLLNSIIDPNPNVIAGSIEQEIINSIEYLRRLSTKDKGEIHINIIISGEIKKYIRRNKFNAQEVFIYTPYEASRLLEADEDITKENDRFCEPMILALMHSHRNHIITVHTEETKKILLAVQLFKATTVTLQCLIPVVILCMLVSISNIISFISQINDFESQTSQFVARLNEKNNIKANEDNKLGRSADIQKVSEIVDLYNEFNQYDTNPINMLQILGSIMPDIVKVNQIDINYEVPNLKYSSQNDGASYQNANLQKFVMVSKFLITFKNYGTTYDELKGNYIKYIEELSQAFKNYSVKVSSLPESFGFADFQKPLSLQVIIQSQVENNEQQQ